MRPNNVQQAKARDKRNMNVKVRYTLPVSTGRVHGRVYGP